MSRRSNRRIATLASMVAMTFPALAQDTLLPLDFIVQQEIGITNGPHALTATDFDGVNGVDLAVIQQDINTVTFIPRNAQGDLSLVLSDTRAIGANPHDVAHGDFNGDTTADIITANRDTNTLTVIGVNNDADLVLLGSVTTGAQPIHLAIADFNGDAIDDFAVVNTGDNTVIAYTSIDGGDFSSIGDEDYTTVTLATGASPSAIATGDFNNDGFADLAVTAAADTEVAIFMGNGDGSFTPSLALATGIGTTTVTSADVNGDNNDDLAIATADTVNGNYGVQIYTSNGNGTFTAADAHSLPGTVPSLIVADADDDGLGDLVAAQPDSHDVALFISAGDGTFTATDAHYDAGPGPTDLVSADFNDDGRADIIATNVSADTITMLLGNGQHPLEAMKHYPIDAPAVTLIQNDFNGDGLADLAYIASAPADTLHIHENLGGNRYADAVTFPLGSGARALISGDFNRDGQQDIASANETDATVTLLTGNGDLTFNSGDIPTGANPSALAAADVDGDGSTDLVTSHTDPADAGPTGPGLSLLYNDGNGNFALDRSLAIPAVSHAIALADFNGDDLTDIAAATFEEHILDNSDDTVSGHSIAVLLQIANNDGSRDFITTLDTETDTVFLQYQTGSIPTDLIVADFNLDGAADLASANSGFDSVTVLLGRRDLQFPFGDPRGSSSGQQLLVTPFTPHSLTTVDLNGDNHPDLALGGDGADDTIAVLRNNQSGEFTVEVDNMAVPDLHLFPVGSAPTTVAAADVDGNGGIDLLFSDPGAFISVLNNAGDFHPDEFEFPSQNDVDLISLVESDPITVTGLSGGAGISVENGEYAINDGAGNFAFTTAPNVVFNGQEIKLRQLTAQTTSTDTVTTITVGTRPVQFVTTTGQGGIPEPFTIPEVIGASLNTLVDSQPFTISGMVTPGAISIANGEYSINNGEFTDQPGAVADGDTVRVRLLSADTHLTPVEAILIIGDDEEIYRVTTHSELALSIQPPFPLAGGPFAVTVADFDKQNGPDMAAVLRDNNQVGILLNPGNGSFDPNAMTRIDVGLTPHAIAHGQFNGDDFFDLVIANRDSNTLTMLLNDGTGGFSAGDSLVANVDQDPTELTIADFNGDGRDDIVALNRNAANMTLAVSTTGDNYVATTLATGISPYAVVTGHFDTDGLLDIAVANLADNNVTVFSGDGNGGFTAEEAFDFGLAPNTLAADDFNGDGLTDLVLASPDVASIGIYLRTDEGGFQLTNGYATGGAVSDLTLAQVNSDAHIDILVTVHDTNDVLILFGQGVQEDGSVVFQPDEFRYSAGPQPNDLAAGDFDQDGILDFVATNYDNDSLSFLPGSDNAELQVVKQFEAGAPGKGIIHADFNNDGLIDVAHAATAINGVFVLLGLAGGDFAAPVGYPVGIGPTALTSNDLDNDGDLDLVSVNPDNNTLSVLFGLGDGTFSATLSVETGARPEAVASADLDGDGDIDVVASHFRPADNATATPGVSVHYNNGDGSFQPAVAFDTPNVSHDLLLSDFNHDGLTDIATLTSEGAAALNSTGETAYALHLLMQAVLSDQSRDFRNFLDETEETEEGETELIATHFMQYQLGSNPEAIAGGDFDGDGLLDIAVTNPVSATISVLYGQNDPVFVFGDPSDPLTAAQLDVAPFIPYTITAGDFDADGQDDLALTSDGSTNQIAILRNSTGNFTSGSNVNLDLHTVGATPTGITVADADQNGGVDVLFTHAFTPFISLLENNTDFLPDSFSFGTADEVELGSIVESASVQINGLTHTAMATVGNGQLAISDDNSEFLEWTDQATVVTSGQWIKVRQTAAATGSTLQTTTLTVGGHSADFNVTTGGNGNPSAFEFASQSGINFNTQVFSEIITITGLADPGAISVTNGEYSINNEGFTDQPGIINDGDAVQVWVISADDYVTDTTATLTIGDVPGTFTVTTRVDTDPDAFRFVDQINVDRNEVIISNSITVAGLAAPTQISITGGEYAINDGDFITTASTVDNDDTVKVRITASSEYATSTDAVITIGTTDDIFSVRTEIDPTFNNPNPIIDEGAGGSSGCSLRRGSGAADPTLPALVVLAVIALLLRRRPASP